jgi:hypothetical protein
MALGNHYLTATPVELQLNAGSQCQCTSTRAVLAHWQLATTRNALLRLWKR